MVYVVILIFPTAEQWHSKKAPVQCMTRMATRITTQSRPHQVDARQRRGRGRWYWLCQDDHAGEDPRFITRRILICAAEDVGLADPMALVLAGGGASDGGICRLAGGAHPDRRGHHLHRDRQQEQQRLSGHRRGTGRCAVGPHYSRADTACVGPAYSGAERLGHGKDYQYAHDFPEHFVAQDYLGAARRYYERPKKARKTKIKERLEKWRAQIEALRK